MESALEEKCLHCQVEISDIDLFTKLIEAHDHLALVSSREKASGLMELRYAAGAEKEVLRVLRHLPLPVQIIAEQATTD